MVGKIDRPVLDCRAVKAIVSSIGIVETDAITYARRKACDNSFKRLDLEGAFYAKGLPSVRLVPGTLLAEPFFGTPKRKVVKLANGSDIIGVAR